ncbi:hypothetical protein Q7689_10485, partial [Nocardiopsis tropica]|nr:hypothetical protein [Nocardiopsis tropica]
MTRRSPDVRARRSGTLLAALAAAVLAAPLAAAPSTAAAEEADASDLTVTYVESARWNTGYTG